MYQMSGIIFYIYPILWLIMMQLFYLTSLDIRFKTIKEDKLSSTNLVSKVYIDFQDLMQMVSFHLVSLQVQQKVASGIKVLAISILKQCMLLVYKIVYLKCLLCLACVTLVLHRRVTRIFFLYLVIISTNLFSLYIMMFGVLYLKPHFKVIHIICYLWMIVQDILGCIQ